jgi:hypothetical protein
MKTLKATILASAALAAAFTVSTVFAVEEEPKAKKTVSKTKNGGSPPMDVSARPPKGPMPIYRPPAVGKPARTVGGGSRGPGDGFPQIYALVPNHVAWTSSQQPSLFWFVDDTPAPSSKIQFTLIDEDGVKPMVEAPIETPKTAGIYRVRLSDFGIELQPNTEYEWSISIVVDPNERGKDIVATGWIYCIEPSDELKMRIASEGEARTVHVYADEGLWYDALTVLGDRIDRNPGDPELDTMRSTLLGQVGLQNVKTGVL